MRPIYKSLSIIIKFWDWRYKISVSVSNLRLVYLKSQTQSWQANIGLACLCVTALCNRSWQASLAASSIEVLTKINLCRFCHLTFLLQSGNGNISNIMNVWNLTFSPFLIPCLGICGVFYQNYPFKIFQLVHIFESYILTK